MKKSILLFTFLFTLSLMAQSQNQSEMNLHSFKMKTLTGEVLDFSTLKGKKVMIVNTASECGLTPQYKQLQELYETYGGKNFVIIGVPSNNFGGQEPGSAEDIQKFCSNTYGVTFQMMEKSIVKGKGMCPLYQWLTMKELNGNIDSHVKWNFQKYLVDENGNLVKVIEPTVSPLDDSILEWITGK